MTATIGAFVMTWQQVILCVSFVAGGIVLALKDKETLAATVLGAAAGYLAQRITSDRDDGKQLPPRQ